MRLTLFNEYLYFLNYKKHFSCWWSPKDSLNLCNYCKETSFRRKDFWGKAILRALLSRATVSGTTLCWRCHTDQKARRLWVRDCVAEVMWPPTDQRALGLRYGWKRGNTVNSLIVSTSHWRLRPHITILFLIQMLFQKLSRKRPLIKFLLTTSTTFSISNLTYFVFCSP